MADTSITQTGFNFNLRIPVEQLAEFWTPEFHVQGIPWRISVRKTVETEEWLGIFLHCDAKEKPLTWTVAAGYTIKLFSFGDKRTTFEKMYTFVFDCNGFGHGYPRFIEWKKLFDIKNNYIKDGMITLNVNIEVVDPNDEYASKILPDINKCCDECNHITLQATVTNINNLIAVSTSLFVLQNMHWRLVVTKKEHLWIYFMLSNKSSNSVYNVKLDFKMKNSIEGRKDFEQSWNGHVKYLLSNPTIKWCDLMKTEIGYVENNSITFEVKIKVDKPREIDSNAKKRHAENPLEVESNLVALECAICLDNMKKKEVSVTQCGHMFCTECIAKVARTRKVCPVCNKTITTNLIRLYLPMYV